MSKYRLLFVSCIVALIALFSGCGENEPIETEASPGSTDNFSSVVTVPEEQTQEPQEVVFVSSCEMAVKDNAVVFIDKTDMLLKYLNLGTGDINIIYDHRVYGEFILDGTIAFFTDAENGMLVCGDIIKQNFTELVQMSLGKGAKIGEQIFFVDSKIYGKEYGLYRYDLATGRWDNRKLDGGVCSPNRQNIYFDTLGVWYISGDSEYAELCFVGYEESDEKAVFTSSAENGITEFYVSEGNIFFVDSNRDIYFIEEGTLKAEKFLDGAVRLCSASSEGVYYQKSPGYPMKLYLGNIKGNSVDILGGVVVESYGSRCLIRRFSGGEEQLVVVKYPEDSVIYSRACTLYDSVSCGRYVIAFICDSSYLYFFDLETGQVSYVENERLLYKGVSVEEYYEADAGCVLPSATALYGIEDIEVVKLFLEAVRRNDRYTLNSLICQGDSLTPYVSFVFSSYELCELERSENTVKYSVCFEYYSENDSSLLWCMPECLRKGSIVLVKENGLWKVDTNAS